MQSVKETQRGRLKIFFSYAEQAGTTSAMLKTARAAQAQAVDVLVGWIDPRTSDEARALL